MSSEVITTETIFNEQWLEVIKSDLCDTFCENKDKCSAMHKVIFNNPLIIQHAEQASIWSMKKVRGILARDKSKALSVDKICEEALSAANEAFSAAKRPQQMIHLSKSKFESGKQKILRMFENPLIVRAIKSVCKRCIEKLQTMIQKSTMVNLLYVY